MIVDSTQQAYRKVLEALSFPGKVNSVDKCPNDLSPLISQTGLICLTLLDSEVTFHVAEETQLITETIHAYTGCHSTNASNADFIVLPLLTSNEEIIKKLNEAKIGDLVKPHKSATIILEIESLTSGYKYSLIGPGIKFTNQLNCTISPEILEKRKEINTEYPLGIDLILVDQQGYVVGLPRTTQIMEVY